MISDIFQLGLQLKIAVPNTNAKVSTCETNMAFSFFLTYNLSIGHQKPNPKSTSWSLVWTANGVMVNLEGQPLSSR